jgi:hypothetical protein
MQYARLPILVLLAAAVSADGPGGPAPAPAPPPGKGLLAVSPLALGDFTEVVPLGNLNPPGHTLPTDHAYFYLADRKRPCPVYAPAAGEVLWVLERRGEAKVMVRVTRGFRYYLDHVRLAPGVRTGARVRAGQRLGVFSGRSRALDLGAVNEAVRRAGFANPRRYPPEALHADSLLRHFPAPLRRALYARVRRKGPDKDGKIDYDVPGRLAGNWFLEGLAERDSAGPGAGAKQLAFVRDVHDPAAVRIAVGGTLALRGVFAVPKGAPDPAGVSRETGTVVYPLLDPRSGARRGRLVVRLVADDRIRVAAFPGARADATAFDDKSVFYRR